MLRSKDPWARAAATRVLCYWRDRVQNPLGLLKTQANDDHPAVRLEAVRAASFFKSPDAAAVAMAVREHPQDRFIEYTFDQTMKTLTTLGKPATTAAAPTDAPPAGLLPDLSAAAMRRSLRDQGTQVVTIGTIPEQMLFDVKWFVVEAGKPVQVTLINSDAMPHNIVIGRPGSRDTIDGGRDHAAADRSECAPTFQPCPRCCSQQSSSSEASRTSSTSPRRRRRENIRSSVRTRVTGCGCTESCSWFRASMDSKPSQRRQPTR
jgi:hypothetical protein